jgi:hypothetical protein
MMAIHVYDERAMRNASQLDDDALAGFAPAPGHEVQLGCKDMPIWQIRNERWPDTHTHAGREYIQGTKGKKKGRANETQQSVWSVKQIMLLVPTTTRQGTSRVGARVLLAVEPEHWSITGTPPSLLACSMPPPLFCYSLRASGGMLYT